ncbi:MAG: hypothetical protein WCX31_12895 [Salinivirgaceae bacterium]|jgi:hypothetical protein
MKKTVVTRWLFRLPVLFIATTLYSCGGGSPEKEYQSSKPMEEGTVISFGISDDDSIQQAEPPVKLDDYKVVLAVDENLALNQKGEMRVWIGANEIEPSFSQGMAKDATTIPSGIGQYAKITPYAPDFEVSPAEMKCIRIDPSGSDVRFSIKPTKKGSLKVSANIELYSTADCSGPMVPKTAATLSVNVNVDVWQVIADKLKEMGTVFWDKFISFWGALIALIFAVFLFIIRRKLKKKTGFDDANG